MARGGETRGISRRTLLVGGGAGVGLLLAWACGRVPIGPIFAPAEGEQVFNAFLKIGNDGRVIVAVPQAELGQGAGPACRRSSPTSSAPTGARSRSSRRRSARSTPTGCSPRAADDACRLAARRRALAGARLRAAERGLMLTGGSTSIRAFERRCARPARGRALLMKAAARRWNVDWESSTPPPASSRRRRRLSFAELAEAAAARSCPIICRSAAAIDNRLAGQPLPRLDLPAKVDGSAPFAGDIRLPDMVYASVRAGRPGQPARRRWTRPRGWRAGRVRRARRARLGRRASRPTGGRQPGARGAGAALWDVPGTRRCRARASTRRWPRAGAGRGAPGLRAAATSPTRSPAGSPVAAITSVGPPPTRRSRP
jgi:isoquinoline 1-oxidoreductase beta subunit